MIAKLKGVVDGCEEQSVLIDTGGVSYRVFVPEQVLAGLSDEAPVSLFIHHAISESHQALYGFLETSDLRMFEAVLKVSGVGPKVALSLLREGASYLIDALAREDTKVLSSFPGIGKKLAERLVVELKDKCDQLSLTTRVTSGGMPQRVSITIQDEAQEALEALGYSKKEAMRAISKAPSDLESTEDVVRFVLKG